MPLQGIRGARSKLPSGGQVSGRIARGREDNHGITRLSCDGQVSGRRRQPGCKTIEQCAGSTDEEGMIAELELMVEKKTTELTLMEDKLTKRNIDVETLEKKVKSYEEIERNQVHHNTEQCDASIKAQTQLIKYQEKENEDLNNQLKERDQQQEVYQEKLKNMTDLLELQTRRMDKQDSEYRKLEKQLQETKARGVESVGREQTLRKELDKTQQNLNDEVNEKKKLQKKIEIQSKQAVNQEKRETEMQNEICQLQKQMREIEDKNKRSLTKDPIVEMQKREKMVVVAIDIGSSHSSYAHSFKHEFNANPTKVYVANWFTDTMITNKAKTCVLFDKNKRFHSFGYEAENNYSELALDGEHMKYFFFKRFTCRIDTVPGKLYIEDDKGQKLPAKLVYCGMIKYLKEHFIDYIDRRVNGVKEDDIHWVLPVPAIWTESERQLMREAAYQAGINDKQLSIVSEPGVAALHVQYLHNYRMLGSEVEKLQLGNSGSRFMVIDLGDNTADITVYTRQPDGGLKELHEPTGGPFGSRKIDEGFNQLLIGIVGAPFFKQFCDKNKEDALDLQREFETKKRTITPGSKGKITMTVPESLAETYKEKMGETVREAIENSPYEGKIQSIRDKLRIDAEIFKGLFKPCCENIVKIVNDVLQTPSVKDTKIFLMVGGFSESAMVQDAMKKAFPNVHLIIPDDASLSVLKGAVIYGHHPLSTTTKILR